MNKEQIDCLELLVNEIRSMCITAIVPNLGEYSVKTYLAEIALKNGFVVSEFGKGDYDKEICIADGELQIARVRRRAGCEVVGMKSERVYGDLKIVRPCSMTFLIKHSTKFGSQDYMFSRHIQKDLDHVIGAQDRSHVFFMLADREPYERFMSDVVIKTGRPRKDGTERGSFRAYLPKFESVPLHRVDAADCRKTAKGCWLGTRVMSLAKVERLVLAWWPRAAHW